MPAAIVPVANATIELELSCSSGDVMLLVTHRSIGHDDVRLAYFSRFGELFDFSTIAERRLGPELELDENMSRPKSYLMMLLS